MDEQTRIERDDSANSLELVRDAIQFFADSAEHTESAEGFLSAAKATLPGQVKALDDIIADLRS